MLLGIDLKLCLLGLLVGICVCFMIGLIYVIFILIEVRKSARTLNRMIEADFGNSLHSIANIIARIDRISSLFLNKLDLLAEGSQKVSSYLKSFIQSPAVEAKSLLAGLKRGVEVIFEKISRR